MVYCGKASLGCQNCRTRRIKCDKVRPECSQCIRASKKCPGYRDQLSLMFRDESSKVMQKAHAQWGGEPSGEGQGQGQGSSVTSPSSGPSGGPSGFSRSTSGYSSDDSPLSTAPPTPVQQQQHFVAAAARQRGSISVPKPIGPTLEQQGVQFYIDRYIIGYPDEPHHFRDLSGNMWLNEPSVQTIMSAVGLAGLANLNGDEDFKRLAGKNYILALQHTGKAIASSAMMSKDMILPRVVMRSVVMLAMFEVVKSRHELTASAQPHIMGAAALIKSLLPTLNTPIMGFKGLIQVCYSMLIPCLTAGAKLPPPYFDWVSICSKGLPEPEKPATELLFLISRFVHLSAHMRHHALADGSPKTADVIRDAVQLEADLAELQGRMIGPWSFIVVEGDLPRTVCFRGRYHTYTDMWIARIWNYYRWAHILVCQTALELAAAYPASAGPLVPPAAERRYLATIASLAEDVIVSVPTHWRHPGLAEEDQRRVQNRAGAGAGSAGVPATLFHLVAAVCAPGVPTEYAAWGLATLDTVWSHMGMLQAKSLAEVVRAHQDGLETATIVKKLVKTEDSSSILETIPLRHL